MVQKIMWPHIDPGQGRNYAAEKNLKLFETYGFRIFLNSNVVLLGSKGSGMIPTRKIIQTSMQHIIFMVGRRR